MFGVINGYVFQFSKYDENQARIWDITNEKYWSPPGLKGQEVLFTQEGYMLQNNQLININMIEHIFTTRKEAENSVLHIS